MPNRDHELYETWKQMRQRCFNPKNLRYSDYGGRGITVCEDWDRSFLVFIEDVGKRPSQQHSLDRIDNDGDYEPSNVKWSTPKEQASNKRPRRDRP